MNEVNLNLAGALAEVRRAYRLLHAYHRRLCDLLQVTDQFLAERGFEFERWEPVNVARLPRSAKPFFRPEYWAWDLTPAYQVECSWHGSREGIHCKVYIHAIADTGYVDSGDREPDPTRFRAAEETASELRVGLHRTRARKPDWSGAWKLLSPITNLRDGTHHQVKVGEDDYTYRYFNLNLAELGDEGAINDRLLLPLDNWRRGDG
ncbi:MULTISPECIES: hypothetical protein [Sorangium]|uniref:Uncharacterized protein n=1 Tax=Sorangium cellulosum TaxID=56 RepID=A0A4P2QPD2_SORCE|nr:MULTISPECIES: hypothetical protein [Sorangium]AUX32024.1 uncharacterized protein SOCE836_041600 [Sorangium cellulosum]WCQ91396.1 hypothetical protein NQZ70_04115 [Sorangium sp. Soce836]